jgi:PIN domain nuclease of toxin-antitoxin system
MKLLLDTHTVIWFINKNARLPRRIRDMLDDDFNDVYVSVVSLWEISIKSRLGKLDFDHSLPDTARLLRSKGFQFLAVHPNHVYCLNTLKLHHKDPFDRMLIAQSLAENFSLVSNEEVFDLYDVQRLW